MTELRTNTSRIVATLKKKGEISLIYRSKIVGVIKPESRYTRSFNTNLTASILKQLKPSKIVPRFQREATYRKHLMKKYG